MGHKHSPEPWAIMPSEYEDDDLGPCWDLLDGKGKVIVVLIQSRADALAMSAALELLNAAKLMCETLNESITAARIGQKVSVKKWRSAMDEGHKAIAKAVGAMTP